MVKEVKPGLYTIDNAYEGVYEYFTEPSIVQPEPTISEESIEDWRQKFGTETRVSLTKLPIEAFDTSKKIAVKVLNNIDPAIQNPGNDTNNEIGE
ncbi:hypothetical protein NUACC21_40710 [Scytonema sp. NUACC21]